MLQPSLRPSRTGSTADPAASHRIAAVVVLYRPERELLLCLLRAIAGEAERIFLFLNSPPHPALLAECAAAAAPSLVDTLGSGVNVGLGRAYNEAALLARMHGCDRLMLFDQDSSPERGMVPRLAAAFDEAGRRFGAVAAVGPRPVRPEASSGAPDKVAFIRRAARCAPSDLEEVAFVISSGSLIDLAAFAAIGPFREDFFIDAIDIEWGFRARARGFCCVMALREAMPHRLGGGSIALPWVNVRLIRQPPARLFTFARNQAAMLRLPHVPGWWKARATVSLALRLALGCALPGRWPEASAIVRGIFAGLRRQLGPPPQTDGGRGE